MLSEIRLLLVVQKFTAELIITRYNIKVNYGFSLTKRDFRILKGNFGYKKRLSFTRCNFSSYKWESRATIYLDVIESMRLMFDKIDKMQ